MASPTTLHIGRPRGGGGLREGGEGVQGGAPPRPCRNAAYPLGTAKMYHTGAVGIYIVMMSEDRQCNLFFGVHTLCPHLNTTRSHKQETQQSTCSWQLCCPACAHNGLHEQDACGRQRTSRSCRTIMAAYLTKSHSVTIGVFRKSVQRAFCAALYASCLIFPLHLS